MTGTHLMPLGVAAAIFFADASLTPAQSVDVEIARKAIIAARTAVKQKKYEETAVIGRPSARFTEIPPSGAVLIGFEFGMLRNFGNQEIIGTVRPIYASPSGETNGKCRGAAQKQTAKSKSKQTQGWMHSQIVTETRTKNGIRTESRTQFSDGFGQKPDIHRTIKLKAKPGYAIAGVTVKVGAMLDGVSVGFMRLTKRGLDAADAYESEWIGSGESTPHRVGYTGDLVIGITGQAADGACLALGLVVINEPMADLVDPIEKKSAPGSAPKNADNEESKTTPPSDDRK